MFQNSGKELLKKHFIGVAVMLSSYSFNVRLTMESDWHVGSGLGRPGSIDKLVCRDSDGLPFVPAKTLHGVWRDACEKLCIALDDGNNQGKWSQLVDIIFGSQPSLGKNDPTGRHSDPTQKPIPAAFSIRPAKVSSDLRNIFLYYRSKDIQKYRSLYEALTFVKPGVKINRRTGFAETNMLRFEEMARLGTVLETSFNLLINEKFLVCAKSLLIASAKIVESLGGKRRRGAGKCKIVIEDPDNIDVIRWLKNNKYPTDFNFTEMTPALTKVKNKIPANDPWLKIPLILKLHSPLAVSFRTIGNVVESLNFVPGSYILPHICKAMAKLNFDINEAIQSGNICVLTATPELEGIRSLPVPMALFTPKNGKGIEERNTLVNRLLSGNSEEQLKQLREGYLNPSSPITAFKTPMMLQTHNVVEDQTQCPTSEVGGVYSYEAISTNDEQGKCLILRSEIRIHQSIANELGDNWMNNLAGNISLGRSKKDDYGNVSISFGQSEKFESRPYISGNEIFVWVVSDTLLRNEQSCRADPSAEGFAKELGRRLGIDDVKRRKSNSNGILDEFVRVRRLDTWHVGWGLPRPSLIAIQAGSCMVFTFSGNLDTTKLAEIEASGIGERTAEGYGQVKFNHELLTKKPNEWNISQKLDIAYEPVLVEVPTNHKSYSFAYLIEGECWKHKIRNACLNIANDKENRNNLLKWKNHNPPMSQLGGLRNQLTQFNASNKSENIITWLNNLKKNKKRSASWPENSIDAALNFVSNKNHIWNILIGDDWPTITVNGTAKLKSELWTLAVRTFFDACIRATKRGLEKVENGA